MRKCATPQSNPREFYKNRAKRPLEVHTYILKIYSDEILIIALLQANVTEEIEERPCMRCAEKVGIK